ncbi:MAG: P1 family peptidase [bacterium]
MKFCTLLILFTFQLLCGQEEQRVRLRELGCTVGIFKPGPSNAITDVDDVRVGHVTLQKGDQVHTGVTVILPHAENLYQEKVPAAIVVGNGFGKLIGVTQVQELGQIETPIVLTNTLSVWEAANGIVDYMLSLPGNEKVRSINPIVGETNDGGLNDIRSRYVTREHVLQAIRSAQRGIVEEGSVGAGTGTICFGWKGGIGTSSRLLPTTLGNYTVGVLVQTNFGGVLDLCGVPIGKALGQYSFKEHLNAPGDGSCMIVVATDAPLNTHQLNRVATRATLALGRTGSSMSNGSGDYVIAFATHKLVRIRAANRSTQQVPRMSEDDLSPLFQATVEATEEAIYNSLLKATTVHGINGRRVDALPLKEVKVLLKRYGRIQ